MILAIYIILFLYLVAMVLIVVGTLKLPKFRSSKTKARTKFSIIVPFRNEVENLPTLIESIAAQNYPLELFEVLMIDDESTDGSTELLQLDQDDLRFSLRIFQNKRKSSSPKKDAIQTAIDQAKYGWILTTDADCKLPANWLRTYDQFIQENRPKMICGPVLYRSGRSFVESFQFLDGLSLQAATMGSFGWNKPLLSNGANLAYEKSAFLEINGYAGNDHIASGDDIFLLEKMQRKFQKKVYYLKNNEATVITKPESSWKDVISQRIRWASKTSKQKNTVSKLLGLIVFLTNLLFIVCLLATAVDSLNYRVYTTFILHKIILDILVMTSAAMFFKTPFSIVRYLMSSAVYPFVSVWVVFHSLRGNYQWKGRSFEK